jgi:RNA polymerase sigma-70 factor, ECF subfamily
LADLPDSSAGALDARELKLFEQLFADRYSAIRYFFVRQGCSAEDSRDLAQEVFISAYNSFKAFRYEADPKTWLLRIAHNKLLNFLRHKRAVKRLEPAGPAKHDEATEEPPDSAGRTPESELVSMQETESIWSAIRVLPPKMRQCLELRISGLEYHEIAQLMGLSIETIKSHLHQARARLRPKAPSTPSRGNS